MRILLVEPPFHSFMHYDRWYYPSSLTQLAAVLHAAGHEVSIYDADKYFYKDLSTRERSVFILKQQQYYDNVDNYEHYVWKHFLKTLAEINPDVVGVSVFTCKLKSAVNTLKLVRKFNPAIKTCVGGAHVTGVPETFLLDEVDGIFTGYADKTFPEWIAQGCPQGIIRGVLKDIDIANLPYPRKQSLLFKEHYTLKDMGFIMTSRGCIGRCTFCSNSFMWSGKPIFRKTESIRAELRELIDEWQVKDVLIADSSFTDLPAEAIKVAAIFKELGLTWAANASWMTMKEDLLSEFIDCGCQKIFVGLESGSDKLLRYMKKGSNRALIREKAKMINALGLRWQLHAIVGFPEEDLEDMQQTLDFAMEIKPTSISLNSFSPLPGTFIYNNIPDMTPDFAASVSQLNPEYSFSKHMDIETFKNMFLKMTETFDGYNKNSVHHFKE
ncbi:MAG: radical SAM protein [Candidatus Omnitrophica bacterium]|nr:radical SAM protein [Candidatus Omnitrophota bacterium]